MSFELSRKPEKKENLRERCKRGQGVLLEVLKLELVFGGKEATTPRKGQSREGFQVIIDKGSTEVTPKKNNPGGRPR